MISSDYGLVIKGGILVFRLIASLQFALLVPLVPLVILVLVCLVMVAWLSRAHFWLFGYSVGYGELGRLVICLFGYWLFGYWFLSGLFWFAFG